MSLQLTLADNFEHSRNAPDNFLWREYVSSGGGVKRSLIIVGIFDLTLLVTSWLPKWYWPG
ncbi:hypothetical protein AYI69_g8906, partial [Smittium culicis]